ncbi:flagellar assembly protein FliW [Marinicrinis lubricantis]|uniref:Flagellar assembly factor FliW n=1 Tax=Marinicrinis lubricantis TaxID=2086470 RepID=A0ABW1ISW0_9BACL
MKLLTKRLGEIIYKSSQVIRFPLGLPGFRCINQFIIVPIDEDVPFSYLQSIDDGDISFIITDPFYFFPDYEISLSEELIQDLQIFNEQDVRIYTIVSSDKTISQATTNLLAPIVINVHKNVAKQYVMAHSSYSTKHRLFSQAAPGGKSDANTK